MRVRKQEAVRSMAILIGVAALLSAAACSRMANRMEGTPGAAGLTLTGAQEVPPVNTQASGVSSITVSGDKNISGNVQTSNLNGTAAHIHEGASGQNGPVIIPLVKTAENVWSVPPNTILSSGQFDAYRTGKLYVNVHSAANPGGEIRAQLKP